MTLFGSPNLVKSDLSQAVPKVPGPLDGEKKNQEKGLLYSPHYRRNTLMCSFKQPNQITTRAEAMNPASLRHSM